MADDMLPKNISLRGIHTLQTDMAEAVTKNNISEVSLIIEKHEAKKREEVAQRASVVETPTSDSTSIPFHIIRNILIVIVTLAVLGGAGYGILKIATQKIQEAPVSTKQAQQSQAFLGYDSLKVVAFSAADLQSKQGIKDVLSKDAIANQTGVTSYQTTVPFKQLLFLLSPSMPAEYLRSLGSQDFFGGNQNGNFFILSVDSHELAFAGSLQWERSIGSDLFPLFHITDSSTLSSFEDRIISNKDVRVALTPDSKMLFVYGFYDSRTLVFARNGIVLKEVYEMLQRRNL